MPAFSARKRVHVPPHIAFDVAADVANYSVFLPLLERSDIVGPVTAREGITLFKAHLTAGSAKFGVRESFVSDVTCDRLAGTVTATSQDGPFSKMKTVWSIRDANGHADVSIMIDYTLRSKLTQLMLAGVMDMAVGKVMTAFEARALAVVQASTVA